MKRASLCVYSFRLILVFCLYFFFRAFVIISLMKAASNDGPFGLLAACPMFTIEMLYCELDLWANKCLLACPHYDSTCLTHSVKQLKTMTTSHADRKELYKPVMSVLLQVVRQHLFAHNAVNTHNTN